MNRAVTLLLPVALFLTAAQKDENSKKDRAKLQGLWIVVSSERNGKPTDRINGDTLTIAGDTFAVKIKSTDSQVKGTLKFDASAAPKTIDMKFTEGKDKDRTSEGIYLLDGDNLKLCLADPGRKPRPSEFVTKADSGHVLIQLKREK